MAFWFLEAKSLENEEEEEEGEEKKEKEKEKRDQNGKTFLAEKLSLSVASSVFFLAYSLLLLFWVSKLENIGREERQFPKDSNEASLAKAVEVKAASESCLLVSDLTHNHLI